VPDQLYESVTLLDSDIEDAPPLIPNVLAMEDKIICVASPKVGKSILAQQLASCVAGGHSFLGQTPVPGDHRVLYIAGEGNKFTIRTRGRRMGLSLPVQRNRLWYWPTPTYTLDSANGLAAMLSFARNVKPTLTVVDPIYALMSGSMRDDEKSGQFVRNMNRYQLETGSALFVVHHTHRPVKDSSGDDVDENDQSYFGSMVWAAWPTALWLMRTEGGVRHNVRLSCNTNRDGPNAVANVGLTMCEPTPLLFVKRADKGALPPVAVTILEVLRLPGAKTQQELVVWTNRAQATVSEALTLLEKQSVVTRLGTSPEQWTTSNS
jgi:hypothetical protein